MNDRPRPDQRSLQGGIISPETGQLLAALAHDLRNPLAPMRTSLELLERPGIGEAQKERARAILKRQMEHMVRLLDDVQELARIGNGMTLQREPVAVAALIEAAAASVRPALDERRQQLDLQLAPGLPMLHVDGTRLADALGRVLQHASRRVEEGAPIRVRVLADAAAVTIAVCDGVPGELASFGLVLAEQWIRLHGGHLRRDAAAGELVVSLVRVG